MGGWGRYDSAMGIWRNIHRIRALPAVDQAVRAGKSLLGSERSEDLSSRVRARLVTVPINFEGHRFSFTAPPDVAGRAQASGVENVVCRTLAHHLDPGDVVIDVGANYGFISMVAGSAVGDDGLVIAVEGSEPIYQLLEATAARNHAHVSCVHATVGNGEGSTKRLDDLLSPLLSRGSAADDGGSVESRPVAAVKIDTDGDDLAVLQGMAELVERDHPLIVVELAAFESEILSWLQERYDHVVDMQGHPITGEPWPPNVFAWTQPIEVKRRRR